MRKKIVAGNWKMNNLFDEGIVLFNEIVTLLEQQQRSKQLEVVIVPSFIFIETFSKLSTSVSIGAQNCASHSAGAFTGEVSAAMLKSVGANYVLIGHSERRSLFSETNKMLFSKINIALKNNLIPIYCIGETLDERESKKHFDTIKQQLTEGVFNLSAEDFAKIAIAYEPVWAIGTGITAAPNQAQEMHAYIRKLIHGKYNATIANNCSILYGGSCNAQNANELFACTDIDGGLIGGASLKANDFVKIVHSF